MHAYDIVTQGAAPEEATHALILLHGRGATAHDILTLADSFAGEAFHVAAPQATNDTWYPESFLAPVEANEPWLSSAVQTVHRLIDKISTHVPPERIYLMGFSQGACLALETAARKARRYAGIAAFTGGLIGERIDTEAYNGDFAGTKIFIGAGDRDPHVPLQRAQESESVLRTMGADIRLQVYPGKPHTILPDEIRAVRQWMF